MIMIILTFLSALSIAAVSAWFSIVGIMAIFAGAAQAALIMGAVLESGKLVAASWLYRNWKGSPLLLRLPLVVFTCILMFITSMGIFGFLSKAHIEQGASASNNTAKIERLDQQIAREQHKIVDSEKMIAQLDAAVNGYTTREKITAAVELRRSQAKQRNQLRDDAAASQALIDQYADQKVDLQTEVRKSELEVGPVKYIAALIYVDPASNLESAVRLVTLIIVAVFDPFAVILLIAANYSLKKRQDDAESRKIDNSGLQQEFPVTVQEDEKEDPAKENNKLADSHGQDSSQEKTTRVQQNNKRTHTDINDYSEVVAHEFSSTAFIRPELSEKVSINEKEETEKFSSDTLHIFSGLEPVDLIGNPEYVIPQEEIIDQAESLHKDTTPPGCEIKPTRTASTALSNEVPLNEKETSEKNSNNDVYRIPSSAYRDKSRQVNNSPSRPAVADTDQDTDMASMGNLTETRQTSRKGLSPISEEIPLNELLQMNFDYEKENSAPPQDEEDTDFINKEIAESAGTVVELEEQLSEIEEDSGKKDDTKKQTVGNYFNKYTGFIPQTVSGETDPDSNLPNISGWLDDERRK